MHNDLTTFVESLPKGQRLVMKGLAQRVSQVLPGSKRVVDTYISKNILYVLTEDALYKAMGIEVESIQLKAVTAIKQEVGQFVIETLTDKMILKPGYGKFIRLDKEGLRNFEKSIRSVL